MGQIRPTPTDPRPAQPRDSDQRAAEARATPPELGDNSVALVNGIKSVVLDRCWTHSEACVERTAGRVVVNRCEE